MLFNNKDFKKTRYLMYMYHILLMRWVVQTVCLVQLRLVQTTFTFNHLNVFQLYSCYSLTYTTVKPSNTLSAPDLIEVNIICNLCILYSMVFTSTNTESRWVYNHMHLPRLPGELFSI